jgi:hypothetical protein
VGRPPPKEDAAPTPGGVRTRGPSLAGLLHLSDERNRIMARVHVDKV